MIGSQQRMKWNLVLWFEEKSFLCILYNYFKEINISVCVWWSRSGENSKQKPFWYLLPDLGIATLSLQNIPENAGVRLVMLSLVFKLKESLEAQPYPAKIS